MRRYLLAGLLLWLLAGAAGMALRWSDLAQSWTGPRLSTPVVVIESDDWGNSVLWGDAARQVREDQAQASAVESLCDLLSRHRDSTGRRPVFTAFVVTGQPDLGTMLADRAKGYHRKPLDQAAPALTAALKKAAADGFFGIAYHAHDHRNPTLWTAAVLRAAEEARDAGRTFGPSELAALQSQALDSVAAREEAPWGGEYYDVREGRLVSIGTPAAQAKVREGLDEILRIFGTRPVSTVAPRYLWGPDAENAWRACGIRFVHGIDWQHGPDTRPDENRSRKLGFRTAQGLIGVPRNVHIEVAPDSSLPSAETALQQAQQAFACGHPALISTHSYNYYGVDPAVSRAVSQCLDQLLTRLEQLYPDLHYLSSEETGQFADLGRVRLPSADARDNEILEAGNLRHAWYWARGLYQDRPKVRVWIWGAAAWGFCVLGASAMQTVRRLAARRSSRKQA